MHKTQFDRARFDFLPCRVKLTQSTALEQKRLDLRSLSPAIPNLWLLLVKIFDNFVKRYRDKVVKHRVPFPTISYQLCLYHFRAFSLAS